MKIFLKLPNGFEFHFQRAPMEREKFYALVALAAGALFVLWMISAVK